MDVDNASISETPKNPGTSVSRHDPTPANVEPANSVVQSDVGSRTEERTLNGTAIRKRTDFEIGYLAGLMDGEGFVHLYYNKRTDHTFPCLTVFCTSKAIVDEACRIMQVNPHARSDHGKLMGWYAQARSRKAVEIATLIAPHMAESSKKCRALTIIEVFREKSRIEGRHPAAEFFKHCPPAHETTDGGRIHVHSDIGSSHGEGEVLGRLR